MNTKILIFSTALLCSMANFAAQASKLTLHNENDKELTVYIMPEGSTREDLHNIKIVIPAKGTAERTITEKEIDGKPTFTVKGETSYLTPSGKCANMDIKEDYDIRFPNLNVGTECVCKMVEKAKK